MNISIEDLINRYIIITTHNSTSSNMSFDIDSLDQVSLRVKSMRKSAGLSQASLAKICGLSQSTIARIENDIEKLNPSYSTIYSIIDELNGASKGGATGEI